MINLWEVLFFVNLFFYLVISTINLLSTRRILRQYRVMNARWRGVVDAQRQTIDELRRQLREQPLPPEPPNRPRSIMWPWRE